MNEDHKNYSKDPTFKQSGLEQPITKFASPLVSHQGNNWIIYGTCIMIAPGFAITAKHVIEELIKTFENINLDHPPGEEHDILGSHNSYVFQIVDGKTGYRWDVRQYFLSANSDICYLRMNPMFKYSLLPVSQKITVTLHAPEIGERIVAFGYPRSEISTQELEITTKVTPMTAIGKVIEVFPEGRDRMLPFPVFRTSARFDAGMSGGPVFNNSGKLCGIICSNMAPFEAGHDHISYVSLIWPSMNTKVWLDLKDHPQSDRFPVLFLAQNNYIGVEGWEHVELVAPNKIAWSSD